MSWADAERVVLLGPQQPFQTVDDVVAELGPRSRSAAINAGWQEREAEDRPLLHAMGRRSVNLSLYRRAEKVWREDPELAGEHKALMDAWLELGAMGGDPSVIDGQRDEAFEAIRNLDRAHVDQVREFRQEFLHRLDPCHRDAVAHERADLERTLADVDIVGIAGGHVASLLNRLRLFGVRDWLGGKRIVAWGAGTMVLAEMIVLFHDSPPWGPGHPEAFEEGLHLVRGLVPLPEGSHRLRLDDPSRTGRLARRFAPDACLVLDSGHRVDWTPDGWTGQHTRQLTPEGEVLDLGRAA